MAKTKAGVIGAAGYAGAELVHILARHPEFELMVATSNSDEGTRVDDLYPALRGACDLTFVRHDAPEVMKCEVLFMATPHTVAMSMVPAFLEHGIAVFDLSADFRLKDPAEFAKWYGVEHTATDLFDAVTFGQPEIFHEEMHECAHRYVSCYRVLVACAGCYPTASSLAAWPAIDLTEGTVVVDAISGVTGAGRSANARTHFCSANENFEAYGVTTHRHTPEIEQILGIKDRLVFTPHLAPASRGILSTVTMKLTDEAFAANTVEQIHERYVKAYAESPFVDVLPLGQMPKTSSVVGTNNVHIGIALDERTHSLVAIAAIDNLIKGAAGQAVQCANIVCGFDQTAGLEMVALPV